MITLAVSVGAVLLHDGELLLVPRGETGQPVYECIGGNFALGLTLPGMIEHALNSQLELPVTATKLLYIVERFFTSANTDVHDITHYYLCEPVEDSSAGERISSLVSAGRLALVKPARLTEGTFAPACLRGVMVGDAAEEFHVSPKLIVDNELREKSQAVSGVFRA